MGTWGSGNFDSDNACELLDELLAWLCTKITTNLPQEMSANGKKLMDGEYNVIPSIDIMITLYDQYEIPPAIDTETVSRWKAAYLSAYDEQSVYFGSTETFVKERRLIIVETFEKLERIIREYDDL